MPSMPRTSTSVAVFVLLIFVLLVLSNNLPMQAVMKAADQRSFNVWSGNVSATSILFKFAAKSLPKTNDKATQPDPAPLLPTAPDVSAPRQARVACLILTTADKHGIITAISRTWTLTCHLVVFLVSNPNNKDRWTETKPKSLNHSADDRIVQLVIKGNESKDRLWQKVTVGMKYVTSRKDANEIEWILKADDDTYIYMQNLFRFLSDKKMTDPYFWGFHNENRGSPYGDYVSGGSGYVVSMANARKIVDKIGVGKGCPKETQKSAPEDFYITRCLQSEGIRPGRTLDSKGQLMFLPQHLSLFLKSSAESIRHMRMSPQRMSFETMLKQPLDCCSPYLIGSHRMKEDDFYLFYFLSSKLAN